MRRSLDVSPQCNLAEAYLGHFEISMRELFCKNSYQPLAVNFFRKKAPSMQFNRVLNMLLTGFVRKSSKGFRDRRQISILILSVLG